MHAKPVGPSSGLPGRVCIVDAFVLFSSQRFLGLPLPASGCEENQCGRHAQRWCRCCSVTLFLPSVSFEDVSLTAIPYRFHCSQVLPLCGFDLYVAMCLNQWHGLHMDTASPTHASQVMKTDATIPAVLESPFHKAHAMGCMTT